MTAPPPSTAPLEGLQRLPGHPTAWFGAGAAGRLPAVLADLGAARVLVVCGGASSAQGGAARALGEVSRRCRVRHVDGVRPNPNLAQVASAVAVAREFRPDAVVGIGGGSVLDVAKSVALLAAQPDDPAAYLRSPGLLREPRRCALVLVPTTSGSGSEMTRFATVYIGGTKHSLDSVQARADVALVDPDLPASLPLPAAVASGLDALSQAVESLWAVVATEASHALAVAALEALGPALHAVAERRSLSDPGPRAELAWGSALAGGAIDSTRTTAAHALSYPLTARRGVPHGVAVALHLRWLVGHAAGADAADCRHPGGPQEVHRLVRLVQRFAGDRPGGLEALLDRLLEVAGHPRDLRELALPVGDWAVLAREALTSARAANHPRLVTEDDVLDALRQ